MGPELPSHHCKGYSRAAEGNGLTWLLPAAIWCLDDHVHLPQIKAVPQPQTAGGYTGTGQGTKGVCLTDVPTVLRHSHSAKPLYLTWVVRIWVQQRCPLPSSTFEAQKCQLTFPPFLICSSVTSSPVTGNRCFSAVLELPWFVNRNFNKIVFSHGVSLPRFGPSVF